MNNILTDAKLAEIVKHIVRPDPLQMAWGWLRGRSWRVKA